MEFGVWPGAKAIEGKKDKRVKKEMKKLIIISVLIFFIVPMAHAQIFRDSYQSRKPSRSIDAEKIYNQSSLKCRTITITDEYTALLWDCTILADTSSNAITLSLPQASKCKGLILNIKCINAAYNVTADPYAAETINGASTYTVTATDNMQIQSDGSNWWII